MERYIVGITGASGSVLAKKLIEFLVTLEDTEVNIIVSETGEKVFSYETDVDFNDFIAEVSKKNAKVVLEDNNNLFSKIASGSNDVSAVFVVPCSMASAGKYATCSGDTLLDRVVDVALKERTKLIIVPRETPLNKIHLNSIITLMDAGATIFPPSPMFYDKATTYDGIIDGIVGRILKFAGVQNNLYSKWNNSENE